MTAEAGAESAPNGASKDDGATPEGGAAVEKELGPAAVAAATAAVRAADGTTEDAEEDGEATSTTERAAETQTWTLCCKRLLRSPYFDPTLLFFSLGSFCFGLTTPGKQHHLCVRSFV